jgi:hypothetical protein
METTTSKTVAFRLGPEVMAELTKAATRRGVSCGEYARDLVTAGLANPQGNDAPAATEKLLKAVAEVHESLATATAAILVHAGKVDEAAAAAWVEKNLRDGQE